MAFDDEKNRIINRKDRSWKGSIDTQILPLLHKINSLTNYYTTSSCAGRIDILEVAKNKQLSKWLLVSHDMVTLSQIKKALIKIPKKELWFKMESAIIHVCCRTTEDAIDLLNKAKFAGFKHSGILSISRRIVLEIFGSEKMETIIARDGNLLVNDQYLKELIASANIKLKETRKRIKKLENLLIL